MDEKKFKSKGIPEEKLSLIEFTGIDTEKYKCVYKHSVNENSIKLLCIARLDESHKYKGIHELIMGIKGINDLKLPVKLLVSIIGDGNLREQYEKECKLYNLNNIGFLGNLTVEEMIKEICYTDFLILPSINKAEGFGRVVLEALSCGTPVIVSKYAGIAELITRFNAGIVYDPFKFVSIFDKLLSVLNNKQELEKFINNGKKLIAEEGLSLSSTTKETVNLYYKYLKNK